MDTACNVRVVHALYVRVMLQSLDWYCRNTIYAKKAKICGAL